MYCNKCIEYDKEMLVYELFDDINNINMHEEYTEIIVRKKENVFFHKHFLNMDFSLNIQDPYKAFKLKKCIYGMWMRGKLVSKF